MKCVNGHGTMVQVTELVRERSQVRAGFLEPGGEL